MDGVGGFFQEAGSDAFVSESLAATLRGTTVVANDGVVVVRLPESG